MTDITKMSSTDAPSAEIHHRNRGEEMKPTPEQLHQAAFTLATTLVARMPEDYAASCKKYAKNYDQLPDVEDFWAWLQDFYLAQTDKTA